MASPAETAVQENTETARLRDEQIMAVLASMRVGLTQEQFDRLMSAIEGRGGLLSDLHKLTEEQKALLQAFDQMGRAMGVGDLKAKPTRLIRNGRLVKLEPPAQPPVGTDKARVFLESSVVIVDVEGGRDTFWLPDCVSNDDTIARIEFLDERGHLLGVTGGERPREQKKGSGQCSTY